MEEFLGGRQAESAN